MPSSSALLDLFPGEGFLRAHGRVCEPGRFRRGLRVERALTGRRKLAAPPLLDAEAPGDRVEPRRDRGRATEVPDVPGHREQRVLEDVPGVLGIPAHLHAEAVHLRLVPLEQGLERPGVSAAGRREQFRVGGSGRHVHRLCRRSNHTSPPRGRPARGLEWQTPCRAFPSPRAGSDSPRRPRRSAWSTPSTGPTRTSSRRRAPATRPRASSPRIRPPPGPTGATPSRSRFTRPGTTPRSSTRTSSSRSRTFRGSFCGRSCTRTRSTTRSRSLSATSKSAAATSRSRRSAPSSATSTKRPRGASRRPTPG